MLASDLQVSLPTVNRGTTVAVAARLLARRHVPALVAADDLGVPIAVISSADILGLMGDASANDPEASLDDRTIAELIGEPRAILRVRRSTPLDELCQVMTDLRAEIAVVEDAAEGVRFVLRSDVIEAVLVDMGDGSTVE